MAAAQAQNLADSPASIAEPSAAGSTDLLDVLARMWGLLRSRPLPEYPPEVVVLALWLIDLFDLIRRRDAGSEPAEVLIEERCHVL